MTRQFRHKTDPIGQAIELALNPGAFIPDRACFSFVSSNALESLSHYATEPAARKLEKAHPDLAARLWRAQGMRIINAKKSKYYSAALSNFERAKHCFERAGLGAEWQKTVSGVRADHQRKSGLMHGFERLAAGIGPSDEPSFLERAKARWSERERRIQ